MGEGGGETGVAVMTQSLWIAGPLPGVNELLAAAKSGHGRGNAYSRLKAEWKTTVHYLAIHARLRPHTGPVKIAFDWIERNRRRDPDNFTGGGRKLILDGLVAAGVLQNDGWAQVWSFSDRWSVGVPGVTVTISDVD